MPKVMVVDDAYSELQVMETILRSAGYEVVTYLDGDELEAKIVEERPDVVLLDIVMPKRNGFEVALVIDGDVSLEAFGGIMAPDESIPHPNARWALGFLADGERLVPLVDPGRLLRALRDVPQEEE